MNLEAIDLANRASLIRFARRYLASTWGRPTTIQVEDTIIFAAVIGNRSGIPSEARTMQYWFENSAWQLRLRAVWRRGELYAPVATHTTVLDYVPPDENPSLSKCEVLARVNEWLQGVPL